MAGRLLELKGSGDFTRGPGMIDGKGLAIIIDAADQTEAESIALAYFPAWVGLIPRASAKITDQGGDMYLVEVDYKNAIPTSTGPGNPPANARPPGAGKNNTDLLTRDMTFSTGGATKKKMSSIATRYLLSANPAEQAPSFGNLIGVTKDGKVEGCEVIAPMCDFTITKRFQSLSLGWFRTMMDTIATTNDADWLGMYAGEVLFKGCDGHYKDGDPNPWTVTAKFNYSRNMTRGDSPNIDDMLTIGGIQIPDVDGHEYVWVSYLTKKDTITFNGAPLNCPIEYPRWAYVETVYGESPFSGLGFDV
jgi:hypothetical protein